MIFKTSKLLSAAVMIASFCAPTICSMQPALAKHEQISESTVRDEVINKKPYLVSKVLIKARPEHVWQVLTDYSAATKVFPTLRKCRILSDLGATKRVQYQIHPTGALSNFEYELEVRELTHKSIEWKRLGGDFKAVEGYWRLEPVEGGRSTFVTYASHVNGGMWLPQALIKRQSRIDIPQVMAALKTQSETTTQIAARAHHNGSHTAN